MRTLAIAGLVVALCTGLRAGAPTREQVWNETARPYTGPSAPGLNAEGLRGKIFCGYQGWFNTEGDGAQRGWTHWSKQRSGLSDGTANVELWPDVSELGPGERFATGFTLPGGAKAEVFSSYIKPTVVRHFEWMKQYGIDGAFVQRFAVNVSNPGALRHVNTVLSHCREGANTHGRSYCVMYDLSGLGAQKMTQVLDDWRALRTKMKITDDPAYMRLNGKPLVAVWGVGFNDNRAYTLAECRTLIEALKNDPEAGGCAVMLGVPTFWRERKNDALPDAELHNILALADVLSPWTVGRYGTPEQAAKFCASVAVPDLAWCAERKIEYLPVVFPGFSWTNLKGSGTFDQIPRRKGAFLWAQALAAQKAGARSLYVAMFDEVDEATAVFKCTNQPPLGEKSKFLTYEGLPSDFYLRLCGEAGKLLRGERPPQDAVPQFAGQP